MTVVILPRTPYPTQKVPSLSKLWEIYYMFMLVLIAKKAELYMFYSEL